MLVEIQSFKDQNSKIAKELCASNFIVELRDREIEITNKQHLKFKQESDENKRLAKEIGIELIHQKDKVICDLKDEITRITITNSNARNNSNNVTSAHQQQDNQDNQGQNEEDGFEIIKDSK